MLAERRGVMKRKKFLRLFSMLASFCASVPVFASAASNDSIDAQKVLNQYQFESHSVGGDIGRQFGWGAITFHHWLVSGLEGVISGVYQTLGGFFQSSDITKLQDEKIRPLIIGLLAIVLVVIGILSIIRPRNFSMIAGNLIVGIVIMLSLPTFLSGAYQLTNQAIDFLDSGSSKISMSDRVLVDNITDNTRYDASNFQKPAYKNCWAGPNADIGQIGKIDPAELIDPGKMMHQDVWKNKLVTDQDGKQSLSELWDGKIGLIGIPALSQYYYRWNIDWFTIISTFAISAFALIFSSIKIARILYELVIQQTMTQALALLDVYSTQRLKRCLQSLVASLVTLFMISFMFQVYIIGNAYIAKVNNPILRLVLMVALAWSVIDGPNLFEQVFGIDAGVHNAVRTMYGMKAAGSIVAGGAAVLGGRRAIDSIRSKGIVGLGKAVAGKAGNIAGKAGGVAAGVAAGAASNHRRYTAVRHGKEDPFHSPASPAAAASVSQAQPTKPSSSDAPDGGAPIGAAPFNQSAASNSPASPVAAASVSQAQPTEPSSSGAPDGGAPIGAAPLNQSAASDSPASQYSQSGQNTVGVDPSQVASSQGPYSHGPETSENQEAQKTVPGQKDVTLGGYVGDKIAKGVRNSGAVRSAKRMYSLAYGSRMAHGDKLVQRERIAHTKMQDNPALSHREALHEAKNDIRTQKKRAEKS